MFTGERRKKKTSLLVSPPSISSAQNIIVEKESINRYTLYDLYHSGVVCIASILALLVLLVLLVLLLLLLPPLLLPPINTVIRICFRDTL